MSFTCGTPGESNSNPGRNGMTLVEILIVVALLGIVLSIALPGYGQYLLRANRTEAVRLVLQAAACLERHYAGNGSYDTAHCTGLGEQQHYRLDISFGADATADDFLVSAVPLGSQLSDPCGSLLIDQAGSRQISGPDGDLLKCWEGR
jgi:type IV pilus assembly protein PilE